MPTRSRSGGPFFCSILLAPLMLLGCGEEPVGTAQAELGLAGSQFEIDDSANLIVDAPGMLDWDGVVYVADDDVETGQNDNSYKGGSKEDTECPATTTGSIPNNKSDLKTFGVYQEDGDPGYLHLFWTRVQDPSGTTLMDFEFNQSGELCANGVNRVRTVDDILLEYRIAQGGAVATLKMRFWDGAAWGVAADLASTQATGTINQSAIAEADAAGLGALDARTFGEASVDLSLFFNPDKCTSFGSAFVKSRSSDSFTSQLKDYIAPIPIHITNCGKVIIRKQTQPDGLTELFDFSHSLATDPVSAPTFQLADDGFTEFTNVLFGTGYSVTEEAAPSGFELVDIDCSASSGVTPAVDLGSGTITFDIDDESDIVDCTYNNRAKGSLTIEKVTGDGAGTFDFSSVALGGFSLTTTAAGPAGMDSNFFGDLDPGSYDVAESVPLGWNLDTVICSDGSNPAAIEISAGEDVTCTFVNWRQRGAIQIHKTYKHAASGPGQHDQANVSFVITGGELAAPVSVSTGPDGMACLDGLVISPFVGNYTVTEIVPAGYVADGPEAQTVAVNGEASCPGGELVNFSNTPLTNITVAVDSIVPGGTASTITCTGLAPATTNPVSGDGVVQLTNLLPATYTCTVVVDP